MSSNHTELTELTELALSLGKISRNFLFDENIFNSIIFPMLEDLNTRDYHQEIIDNASVWDKKIRAHLCRALDRNYYDEVMDDWWFRKTVNRRIDVCYLDPYDSSDAEQYDSDYDFLF